MWYRAAQSLNTDYKKSILKYKKYLNVFVNAFLIFKMLNCLYTYKTVFNIQITIAFKIPFLFQII